MVYLGPHMKVDFDRLVFDDLDEIIVMQQHCGGENRTVFKSFLKAGGSKRMMKDFIRMFCFNSQMNFNFLLVDTPIIHLV